MSQDKYNPSSDLCDKIRDRLKKSPFWTDRSKENGNYLQGIICPECGHREAWAYKAAPFSIVCNRASNCGARVKTLSLFPEIIQRIEKEYQPTKEDPHRPARQYLHSRGLNKSIEGLSFEYRKNIRKTGSGGVMFPVGTNAEGKPVSNGRLFNPPPGEGKTHNQGATTGMYWKHPAVNYDPGQPTYITEGIIDALSLIEMGYQAIAVLSSGQDPSKIDLGELAGCLVIAFDPDSAGAGGLRKWTKQHPKAGAITPTKGDWNDILLSGPLEKVKKRFEEKYSEFETKAKLLLAENGTEYAKIYHEFYGRAAGLYVYGGCYWFAYVKPATEKREEQLIAYRVSNFTLKVDHYQLDTSMADEPTNQYFLKIQPQKGRFSECSVTGAELSTPAAIRAMFLTRARVLWEGDAKPSISLARLIVESGAPVVRQLQILGHDLKSNCYVLKDFAIDPIGKILEPDQQGFFRISRHEYLRAPSQTTIRPKKGIDPAKLYHLVNTAWPDNAALAIAYMVASWFVNMVKPELGFFPFLSLHGDTQTGKTRLIRIVNAMQCLDEEGLPMTKLNTGKGEIRKLAQRSGLFKALLEGNKEENTRFDLDSILTLYNHGNHLQVRALKTNDIQTHETEFLSSMVFVQNKEPFKTKAQMERIVSSRPFATEGLTPETTKAFNELVKVSPREIAFFFVEVMRHRGRIEQSWFGEHEKARAEILEEVDDNRIAENHGLILGFHRILCQILKIEHDMKPFIAELAKCKHRGCSHREATLADHFFEAVNELLDADTMAFLEVRDLKLHIKLPRALKILDGHGYKFGLTSSLRRDLREHPAFMASNHQYRGYFGATTTESTKVWLFDAQKI